MSMAFKRKHGTQIVLLIALSFTSCKRTSERPSNEAISRDTQKMLVSMLSQNSKVDPNLSRRADVVAEELFKERGGPAFDWRHLSRRDWADVHRNSLTDKLGNQYVITYNEGSGEWIVTVKSTYGE